MSKSYYRKAENIKEELLARFCKVINYIAGSEKYGLTKGWDLAQIVTTKEYKERLNEEGAEVLNDGVIMITKG